MLLSYPVKALEHMRGDFDATLALGLLAPVIAGLVWLSLRSIRRRIEGR